MTSGHWEAAKSTGKTAFCSVSGGYVLVGFRNNIGFEVTDQESVPIENYINSAPRNFIKQNLGDKIIEEVDRKVKILMEIRNKQTTGPGKES
mmetsp:Transcript_21730/g.30411  ORF Transcript_21730/g.30411 Transcript_21730/m.30411 type:complete len:92 (+) Transcript_21730:43-318(+)|eukprot:CAMPEP_0168554822 /NCGR_PEP_ID=MMETSP0413-20121227/7993_1 /TAXON_ID=136452 /ORGANISM="Filamoeba nolandi, Strain NC-AS-23-1" /LENGTH=91 /DNA_ID=CAMNT_0008585605 /DNA_START=30 /DNA_END=305 /DNA_ORIENTATION=-